MSLPTQSSNCFHSLVLVATSIVSARVSIFLILFDLQFLLPHYCHCKVPSRTFRSSLPSTPVCSIRWLLPSPRHSIRSLRWTMLLSIASSNRVWHSVFLLSPRILLLISLSANTLRDQNHNVSWSPLIAFADNKHWPLVVFQQDTFLTSLGLSCRFRSVSSSFLSVTSHIHSNLLGLEQEIGLSSPGFWTTWFVLPSPVEVQPMPAHHHSSSSLLVC